MKIIQDKDGIGIEPENPTEAILIDLLRKYSGGQIEARFVEFPYIYPDATGTIGQGIIIAPKIDNQCNPD